MSTFPKRPITAATNSDALTMTIIVVAVIVQGVVYRATYLSVPGGLTEHYRGLAPQSSGGKDEAVEGEPAETRTPRPERLLGVKPMTIIAENESRNRCHDSVLYRCGGAGVCSSVYSLDFGLDDRDSIPGRGRDVFATASSSVLGATQSCIHGIPGAFSRG
jgi:hypothetical protein